MGSSRPVAPKSGVLEVTGKGNIQGQEMNRRTCWHCNEPWVPGHNLRCKVKRALHVILMQGGSEEEEVCEEPELTKEPDYVTAPASPEVTDTNPKADQLMSISSHTVKGMAGHAPFSLITVIGGKKAIIWWIVAAQILLWTMNLLLRAIVL